MITGGSLLFLGYPVYKREKWRIYVQSEK